MQSQTLKRYLVYSLLIASFTLLASSARAQDRKAQPLNLELPVLQNSCPKPIALTLNATTPNVFNADFNATQLGGPRAWLNDAAINKSFLYTFQWKQEERCCEITKAVLTVKMKANQDGKSLSSSDACNDGIAIMNLGNVVPPFSQAVYTCPFTQGQPSVKTWTLTGAALTNLNANRRLSIYVQDDTMVQSASLQIWGCCLTGPKKDMIEEASPTGARN